MQQLSGSYGSPMRRIGTVSTKPMAHTRRDFQTALWWETGRFDEQTVELRSNGYMFSFALAGEVVSDYFASNFAGCSVQPYDSAKNAGKDCVHHFGGYVFSLSQFIANSEHEIELDADVELRDEPVTTGDGRDITLTRIWVEEPATTIPGTGRSI